MCVRKNRERNCNGPIYICKNHERFFHGPKWTEGMCYAFDIGTGGDEGSFCQVLGFGLESIQFQNIVNHVMVKIYLM